MKQYVEDASVQGRIAEIEGKLVKLRAVMAEQGWDGAYISKSEHFAWVTAGGDNIVTRYVEGGICAILITAADRYYICNNIETKRMQVEEKLEELGFKPLTMYWYEDLSASLIASVMHGGKLAADIALPGAADCNGALLELEKVLCDNEIARYIHMGDVFSRVIESYLQTVKPGDTEIAIAGRLGAKMWESGLEPVLVLVAADQRIYDYRHAIPTAKAVDKFLMVSCNARYKGLITKITRMVYFGKAPEALLAQYRKTVDIENRLVVETKPGVDDLTIFELSKKLYAEAGYPDMWKVHHQGGPQSYTNGFYLITEHAHGIVREGQIYGYNPSITGTKTEDAVLVTAEGPVYITYPVSFPVIESVVDGHTFRRPGILEITG